MLWPTLQPYQQWHFLLCVWGRKCLYPRSAVYYFCRQHLVQHQHQHEMVAHLDPTHELLTDISHAVSDFIWFFFVQFEWIRFLFGQHFCHVFTVFFCIVGFVLFYKWFYFSFDCFLFWYFLHNTCPWHSMCKLVTSDFQFWFLAVLFLDFFFAVSFLIVVRDEAGRQNREKKKQR